jgi:succinoglycan biosynthesis transport protein ExoP
MFFRKKSKAAAPPAAVAPAPAPAPEPAAFSPTGEPDLRGLGQILWRRKGLILGITLATAAAAFVAVNAVTPRYRSESRLLLEARENVFLRADADKAYDRSTVDAEAVASQVQVMLSRDLAREVIRKEKLADNPEFEPTVGGLSPLRAILGVLGIGRSPTEMTKEERTMEAYYDRLNVSGIDKSRVISIEFSSANPDLAARVANAIAETYLSMQQAAKVDQTRAAGNWLAGEIEKMRAKVAEAEAKVEDYRTRSNLFMGSNNTTLPSQQLTELNSQIAAARGQKADLEARAKQLRQLIRSGKPIESSDIANSESMRRLIEQRIALRSQLAEQSTTLLDRHPRILELKAQIAEIDRQIRAEGERLAQQLDNDAKLAGDRLESLTASIDQVKQVASHTNEQDVQLRALEREARTQRDLLESYLVKYREASARDSISAAPAEARIISRATPALVPAYPKKLPTVLIAAFAAFALSSGFVMTGALLGGPTAAPAAFAYAPGYAPAGYAMPAYPPLVAQPAPPPMPDMRRVAAPPLMPAMGSGLAAQPQPQIVPLPVASIEQVARNLRQAGDAGRRIAVVGTARNAGTTYTAIMLARALAQEANVVLADLAFGAPNLSVISTDANAPGLSELVRGAASFGDIITRDQYSPVHVVATGAVGEDPAQVAASPMLATAVEALAQSYEHVVLDIGSVADVAPERFAPFARCAVLVAADPAAPGTRAARDRLLQAGFAEVTVVAGASQAAAA